MERIRKEAEKAWRDEQSTICEGERSEHELLRSMRLERIQKESARANELEDV